MDSAATPPADILDPPKTPPAENGGAPLAAEEWREDKNGKQYVPRQGKRGIISRQGKETVEEARIRDAAAHEKRPRRRSNVPKSKQEAPRKTDLRELEKLIAEALKMPAIAAGMAGDEWAVDHFTRAGPYLARNLIVASEHNPWLRRKLEEMAAGEAAMMTAVSLVPVIGGVFMYLAPPVVYWFNLPIPDSARLQLGVPPRRLPAYATAAQGTETAEQPLADAA